MAEEHHEDIEDVIGCVACSSCWGSKSLYRVICLYALFLSSAILGFCLFGWCTLLKLYIQLGMPRGLIDTSWLKQAWRISYNPPKSPKDATLLTRQPACFKSEPISGIVLRLSSGREVNQWTSSRRSVWDEGGLRTSVKRASVSGGDSTRTWKHINLLSQPHVKPHEA